ncbi:hypothetical protein [Caudoviricetes sp.]|nr:hypothetical protein [Caudoviricetes sp.]UOF81882.1 hypothetical protein [Caudoviricetes sp.]
MKYYRGVASVGWGTPRAAQAEARARGWRASCARIMRETTGMQNVWGRHHMWGTVNTTLWGAHHMVHTPCQRGISGV